MDEIRKILEDELKLRYNAKNATSILLEEADRTNDTKNHQYWMKHLVEINRDIKFIEYVLTYKSKESKEDK